MIHFSHYDFLLFVSVGLSIYSLFWGLLTLVDVSQKRKNVEQRLLVLQNRHKSVSKSRFLPSTHWIGHTSVGRALYHLLKDADLGWHPYVFLLVGLLISILFMVAISIMLQISIQQNAILSFLLAFGLLIGYMHSRRGKRERDLQTQISEIAILMANSFRAGLAMKQALASVVDKIARPANEEFGDLLNQINAGLSTELALRQFMKNHPGEEVQMLITALLIHQETGGDLSKTLSSIASAVLARQRLNDEIRTTTAEGRYSSFAIVGLSVAVLIILNMATGGVLKEFLQLKWSTIGITWLDNTPLTLGFSVFLLVYVAPQAMAFVLIRRISQVHI